MNLLMKIYEGLVAERQGAYDPAQRAAVVEARRACRKLRRKARRRRIERRGWA